MQTQALLADYIQNRGLCPGAATVDEWMGKNWFEVRVRTAPSGCSRSGASARRSRPTTCTTR